MCEPRPLPTPSRAVRPPDLRWVLLLRKLPASKLHGSISNRLLRKGAVLYDEAELVIKEVLGADAATYLSIIAAVAGGATRQFQIAARAGIETPAGPCPVEWWELSDPS